MGKEVDRRDFLKTAGVGAGAALTVGSNLLQRGEAWPKLHRHPKPICQNPLIPIDLTKSPKDQVLPLHNRWHPDIPPVVTVKPGGLPSRVL
jgi:formamidase